MRKISIILLAVMLVISLAGCAGKSQSEILVVYTSMKDSLITALTDEFKEKHPNITVEVRVDGAGSLMSKIESEREAGQIIADVIWTSEVPDFYYMKNEGLLLQYNPSGAEKVLNPMEDADGYFIPARLGTMGIAYNTDIIKTPPTTWRDLTKPEYKDGFAIANPQTSGTALMAVLLLSEAFGEGFFRNIKSNGAFIGQGSTWVVESIASGEIAAGLAVDYITFDKAESGAPIAIAYPEEMLVIPSPVAIFKDSANISAAKKFVDYLISQDAQQIVANMGTLPVFEGIAVPDKYNVPAFAEAASRAINVNETVLISRKDAVVGGVIAIINDAQSYTAYINAGISIGVEAGDVFGDLARDLFKSDKVPEYAEADDMLTALKNGEVDAILLGNSYAARLTAEEYEWIDYLWIPKDVFMTEAAPVFHTAELRDKYNEWYRSAGALRVEIERRWLSGIKVPEQDIPRFEFTGENGTLRVCDTGNYPPLSYRDSEGNIVGFDAEIASRFAMHLGMDLEITAMPYEDAIAFVEAGNADMSACTFAITAERVGVIFGEPSVVTQAVLIVRKGTG